jgi:EAL domain-containing protein (putative c-di-GMP-specific phosphodiesterase class I)
MILALVSSMGCDLSQGYFLKKNLLGSIETAMDILEL